MKKHTSQYSFIVDDFYAKVGNCVEMTALGNFGGEKLNGRGDMLIVFAERNNLKVTSSNL